MNRAIIVVLLHMICLTVSAQKKVNNSKTLWLENDKVKCGVEFIGTRLSNEQLVLTSQNKRISSDADFGLEIVWTDWIAPGMYNNAENPVILSKKDFEIKGLDKSELPNGDKQIEVHFQGTSNHLQLKVTYLIEPGKYYLRRKIAVRDTIYNKHFLHKINAYDASVSFSQSASILKEGGFGQPVALQFGDHGFYAGLEYPAATNVIKENEESAFDLECFQLKGMKISYQWIESDWVVLGLTPESAVKKWFMEYIDDIKVSPNKPYTIYNSWYDLRGEKYQVGSYVKVLHEEDYMTEKNVLRLYDLFKTNFTDKYNVDLDAFVLDDGWDVYESDWVLNKNEFPKGLTPLKKILERNNTSLGMWFGPSGGYSFRMKRVNWFRENGYEVVGEEKQWGGAQLCLAGKNYSKLFKQRTADFVNEGVSYYKWDGFQFSCSEVGHGHPIGLYSHVSVLDTLLSAIEEIHEINMNVYHSVSSPWWLKHADQIWMQGEDYGLAEVPSYDLKDAAITYRDVVLYDDLQRKKNWFPVSNMMTHGIIKGKLEELYLDAPLDKFTDNALLYFARGVSMYELYTSPDVMTEQEWEVLASALKWAKSHFNTLMNTEMIGGDPANKQAYGYLHLKEKKGIIAARNPYINEQKLEVELSAAFGLDKDAKNLVLEKVYPYRWISPVLYKTGDVTSLPLSGYETAIYEIYPMEEATEPLVAGVPFYSTLDETNNFSIQYLNSKASPKILNYKEVKSLKYKNEKISMSDLPFLNQPIEPIATNFTSSIKDGKVIFQFETSDLLTRTTLALLLTSKKDSIDLPESSILLDKKTTVMKFNGAPMLDDFKIPKVQSGWFSIEVPEAGNHEMAIDMDEVEWEGIIEAWIIGNRSYETKDLKIQMKRNAPVRILAPQILEAGSINEKYKLGNILIE